MKEDRKCLNCGVVIPDLIPEALNKSLFEVTYNRNNFINLSYFLDFGFSFDKRKNYLLQYSVELLLENLWLFKKRKTILEIWRKFI